MRLKTRVGQWLKLALADAAGGNIPERRHRRRSAGIEAMEARTLLSAIIVTSLADNLNVDGKVTLREAIQAANADLSVDGSTAGSGADVITFMESLSGTIGLMLGEMGIDTPVTIIGNGLANTIIDGNDASRMFDISNSAENVTITKLTLTRGKTTAAYESGGAIRLRSTGMLTLSECTLSGNSTIGEQASGGAVWSGGGVVTLQESTCYGNSTTGNDAEGGAIAAFNAAVRVIQSTLSNNLTEGTGADGGAIFVFRSPAMVIQSTVTENVTALGGAGGGIFSHSSPITIQNSIVAGNTDNGTALDIFKLPDPGNVFIVANSS